MSSFNATSVYDIKSADLPLVAFQVKSLDLQAVAQGLQAQLAESHDVPPVPSTAIYSQQDGIVAWQNSREPKAPHTDNIEVKGSHCGLGVNPTVLWAIADRLAQEEGQWKPFERGGIRSLLYPSSGH